MSPRILHVEVGGSYGGSLRALELYLTHTRPELFEHDLLFYYPTPGSENLAHLVRKLLFLYDSVPPVANRDPAKASTSRRKWLRDVARKSGLLVSAREWSSLFRARPLVRRLESMLREGRYNLVHVNNTFPYQAPVLRAARRAGIPVVAHVRNPVRKNPFTRRLLSWTNTAVTVNRSLQEELASWGTTTANVVVCYDPMQVARPQPQAVAELRSLNAPHGEILIGSIGRLDKQKGYDYLIRAARKVVDVRPDVKFLVAGEGPERPALEALIAKLNLSGKFELCGFRKDVSNFLASLDIFVCSSLYEGGPLVVLEASTLGKPVVSTRVGFVPEVIVPGVAGELVPPADSEALASATLLALDRANNLYYKLAGVAKAVDCLSDPMVSAQILDGFFLEANTGS